MAGPVDLRMIAAATPGSGRVAAALDLPETHFAQRCRERGIESLAGNALQVAIAWAVETGRDDLAEPVFWLDDRNRMFRFRAPEGLFYAVVDMRGHRGPWPVTVYTADMLRKVREARKRRQKAVGCREKAPDRKRRRA